MPVAHANNRRRRLVLTCLRRPQRGRDNASESSSSSIVSIKPRARARTPSSIAQPIIQKQSFAATAASFVVSFVMAWSPFQRANAGIIWLNSPETTPTQFQPPPLRRPAERDLHVEFDNVTGARSMHQARHDAGSYQRVELITGRRRRRDWSDEEKARILAESAAPGVKVSEVARRNGVSRGAAHSVAAQGAALQRNASGAERLAAPHS